MQINSFIEGQNHVIIKYRINSNINTTTITDSAIEKHYEVVEL